MQLDLNGISIEIIRKPIKNIYLRILPPDGNVIMTAPLKLSLKIIHQHLENKQAWIRAKRQQFLALPRRQAAIFETGEGHYFLGERYSMQVYENTGPMKIVLQEKILHFYIKTNATIFDKNQTLGRWYRKQLQAILPKMIAKWEPIIGVTVASFGIKQMKTRWGSCNTRTKRIWLNVVLIQKTYSCLEYVLVHEMIHLLEPSHNKRFYAFMTKFFPNWKECHQQLRKID